MLFSDLGLSVELLQAIAQQGYTTPTPVQRQAIPWVLQGQDVLVGAQTGTGKTAGFTLPMLQRLQEQGLESHGFRQASGQRPVRALVLTPTRELASQVGESVKAYGQRLPLKTTVIYGGVSIRPQIRALQRGVDIVVATPGRLLDHMSQRTLDLSHIEIVVLDEADRMLDMGFIHDIRKILRSVPGDRQTLLFSATFSKEIRTLAQDFLVNPQEIQIARRNTAAESVSQRVVLVDQKRKRELLSYMIGSQNWQQVLVFTRTKHRANRLAEQLKVDGLKAAAIHGDKSQNARTKALAQFKSGKVRVLVATDIAARGLDIQQLPHVVNYELPHVPEDYVHRIGRTGRAGCEGEAVSLVCGDEKRQLRDIERLLKCKIEQDVWEGYEPAPASLSNPDLAQGRSSQRKSRSGQSRRRRSGGRASTASSANSAGKNRGRSRQSQTAQDSNSRRSSSSPRPAKSTHSKRSQEGRPQTGTQGRRRRP